MVFVQTMRRAWNNEAKEKGCMAVGSGGFHPAVNGLSLV